jgi:hypothetical protein
VLLVQVQVLGMLAALMGTCKHAAFLVVMGNDADTCHWKGQIAHFIPGLRALEYRGTRAERAATIAKLRSGGPPPLEFLIL